NDGHPEEAHYAQREQDQHQAGAATDAVAAVTQAHPHGAEPAALPAAEDVMQRRAAVAQTEQLERRQLVEAGGPDQGAGYLRPLARPGEKPELQISDAAIDRVRSEAVERP